MQKKVYLNKQKTARWMSIEEVQAHLDISRPTAYDLVKREGFPAFRVGRTFRIPREGFLRWIEEQTGQGVA